MKGRIIRRTVTSLALVGAMLLPAAAGITVQAAEPDSYHDDWLHVNENAEIVEF